MEQGEKKAPIILLYGFTHKQVDTKLKKRYNKISIIVDNQNYTETAALTRISEVKMMDIVLCNTLLKICEDHYDNVYKDGMMHNHHEYYGTPPECIIIAFGVSRNHGSWKPLDKKKQCFGILRTVCKLFLLIPLRIILKTECTTKKLMPKSAIKKTELLL